LLIVAHFSLFRGEFSLLKRIFSTKCFSVRIKISRKTFGHFGKERVFFVKALAFAAMRLILINVCLETSDKLRALVI